MERERSSSGCLVGKEDWPCLATLACSPPSPTHHVFFLSRGAIASCRKAVCLCCSLLPRTFPPAVLDASFFFSFFFMAVPFLASSAVATFPVVSPVLFFFFAKLGLSNCSTPACWFRARYVCQVCDRVTCAEYVYVSA